MQDGQNLADLASGLALLQLDNEPQPGAGGQSQILLRHSQGLPCLLYELANLLGSVFHQFSSMLPYGNIARLNGPIKKKIPDRELLSSSATKSAQ
jgi:hypothetical protein